MVCIIGSETTQNYGLFRDLSHRQGYLIVYARLPRVSGTLAWRIARRMDPKLPDRYLAHARYKKTVLKKLKDLERLIVVDTALRLLDLDFLKLCKSLKPDLQVDCLLLNSTKSWTHAESNIHSRFYSFHWDTVLTTDPADAETHNWQYTGLHYYSKIPLHVLRKTHSDLFYAGSFLSERGKKLLRLLDCFNANNVNCLFICPGFRKSPDNPKGLCPIRKRISYRKMLRKMMGSNCILEVLQDGQTGSTLRYLEAVCYNKKLLTSNPRIKNYPFYDERYMKVFSSESDIDYDWVKKRETINYGYKDEFSPKYFFNLPSSVD